MEYPDKAILMHYITEDEYAVFGSWYGGYLGSDSWKRSSAIKIIELEGDMVTATTESGNQYIFSLNSLGTSGYAQGVLNSAMAEEANKKNVNLLGTKEQILEVIQKFANF